MGRLCKLAEENQVKILPHISLETNYRLQNVPELEYLERQLFRFPVKSYGSKAEAIRICAAEDAEEEIYYIAKTIKEYVLSGQYRYRDFAIVTGDMGEQAAIWHMVMQQLEIPYFMDVNEAFVHNPVAEVTNMVLDVVLVGLLGWSVEGAAIATFISQIVGGVLPVFYFLNRNNTSRLHLKRPHRRLPLRRPEPQ